MMSHISQKFPVGRTPKSSQSEPAEKNLFLYFRNGEETDKQYSQKLYERRKLKYTAKLGIEPNTPLEDVKSALIKQNIGVIKNLRIYVSGHSQALNFVDLTLIQAKERKIGGKYLAEVGEIISYAIKITNAQNVKVNLSCCETGVIPGHRTYDIINKTEIKYHNESSGMMTQAMISLLGKPLDNESSAEHIARKLKIEGHSRVQISGINGILLGNDGKTDAVISREIYAKEKPYEDRKNSFVALRQAIESKDFKAISECDHKNLMHIRKVKIKI